MKDLASMPAGAHGVVAEVRATGALLHRLQALGLRPGRPMKLLRRAVLGGPLHLRLGTTELLLRAADATRIDVTAVAGGGKRR